MDTIRLTLLPLLALALAVAAVYCIVAILMRERRGRGLGDALSRCVAEALIGVSIVVIWGVTLAPSDVLVNGAAARPGQLNLLPVLPLLGDVADVSGWRETLPNLVGNVLLFVPLGFALRWRFRLRMRSILLIAVATSSAIEITQAVSDQMRTADIDDVLLNAPGAFAGAWVYAVTRRLLDRPSEAGAGPGMPDGRDGP